MVKKTNTHPFQNQVTEKLGLHNLRDLDPKDLKLQFFPQIALAIGVLTSSRGGERVEFFVCGWRVKYNFFSRFRFFFLWH